MRRIAATLLVVLLAAGASGAARAQYVMDLGSLIAALPGAVVSPGWGWLVTAILVATLGWGLEQWKFRGSR